MEIFRSGFLMEKAVKQAHNIYIYIVFSYVWCLVFGFLLMLAFWASIFEL